MAPNSVQRVIGENNLQKAKIKSPNVGVKKTVKKPKDKPPIKVSNSATEKRHRTATVPKVASPNQKENKSMPVPSSVTKSVKKPMWKRRPKPAHSGVPVPENMKKLGKKLFNDLDCSL